MLFQERWLDEKNRRINTGKRRRLFDGGAAVCRTSMIEPAHMVTRGNDQRRDASANSHLIIISSDISAHVVSIYDKLWCAMSLMGRPHSLAPRVFFPSLFSVHRAFIDNLRALV